MIPVQISILPLISHIRLAIEPGCRLMRYAARQSDQTTWCWIRSPQHDETKTKTEHQIHYRNKTELLDFAFLLIIDRGPVKRIQVIIFFKNNQTLAQVKNSFPVCNTGSRLGTFIQA